MTNETDIDKRPFAAFAAACALAGAVQAGIEIHATGTWAVDGVTSVMEVRASSPAGGDVSKLRWCVCDASNAVVLAWNRPHGGIAKTMRLKIGLKAGEYSLRATDGVRFYGNVPIRILPRGNRHVRAAVEIREPPDPKRESGAKRFWRDMLRGEFSQAGADVKTPRRVVARFCAEFPERVNDIADFIERTAAEMKGCGENALVCPAEWAGVPDHLSAWYAKFNEEGLTVFPMVAYGSGLQRRIGDLVSVGMRHESFGGVCVRVARQGDIDDDARRRLARPLSEMRALWVLDDADLKDFVGPLRTGDAAALVSSCGFPDGKAGCDARIPSIQAFRSLPAINFLDVGVADCKVRVRHAEYDGASWFYVFNPGPSAVRVKMKLPTRARDLARDERVGGLFGPSEREFVLEPSGLRSFSAPEGIPAMLPIDGVSTEDAEP